MSASPLSADREIYFDDPRFRMTVVGRLLVRVISVGTLAVGVAATCTLLISDGAWMRALGILLFLVLIERYYYHGNPDRMLDTVPASGPLNVAPYMTPAAFRIVEQAYDRVVITHTRIGLALFEELLTHASVQQILVRLDCNPTAIRERVRSFTTDTRLQTSQPPHVLSQAIGLVVVGSFAGACARSRIGITPADLFAALPLLRDEHVDRIWAMFRIDAAAVQRAALLAIRSERAAQFVPRRARTLRHHIVNRAWTSRPTPLLDTVATDLTDAAYAGGSDVLVGHAAEYEQLISALTRTDAPRALLVGAPGGGGDDLITHLAAAVIHDAVPASLFDKRLVALDTTALLARATGDAMSATVQAIVDDIRSSHNVILYVPQFHVLLKATHPTALALADALLPLISSGAFPVIASTYPREFRDYIEPRSDIVGSFAIVPIGELSDDELAELLVLSVPDLERRHRVTISFTAIDDAVRMSQRYFSGDIPRAVTAQTLLQEAVAVALRHTERVVTSTHVASVVENKTHIPVHEVQAAEKDLLLHLEERLHQRLIGQEEAVRVVAEALRSYRSGLTRTNGPIASFLFVGPTGVGKTELARELARSYFGDATAFVRVDMSECSGPTGLTRLIGTPDGAHTGLLTEPLRTIPYRLVLLDELEKASPEVLNALLSVLDDGRIVDGVGRTIDCRNAIIIATSNAQAALIMQALEHGEAAASIAEYVRHRLTDVFVPELLNRFSRIVVFRNLTSAELTTIARLQLTELAQQLTEQQITLVVADEAITALVQRGYDPVYGARPLRRVIDDSVRAPVADALLRGELVPGSTATITVHEGAFHVVAS